MEDLIVRCPRCRIEYSMPVKAVGIAEKLANGPSLAQRWTKQSLNQWLRMAAHTSFDTSVALEMLGFMGTDIKEGIRALKEKRPPSFHPK